MEETKSPLLCVNQTDNQNGNVNMNDRPNEDDGTCSCKYVHYGNVILVALLGWTFGFLSCVYWNYPWGESLCHNSTHP